MGCHDWRRVSVIDAKALSLMSISIATGAQPRLPLRHPGGGRDPFAQRLPHRHGGASAPRFGHPRCAEWILTFVRMATARGASAPYAGAFLMGVSLRGFA